MPMAPPRPPRQSTMMPFGHTARRPEQRRPGRCRAPRYGSWTRPGARCHRGEPGEIWIKGPMVVPGYFANDTATRDAFVAGYWRSGDIGAIDTDGYLHVLDRLKDMINRGGYKVFSAEVEDLLHRHPQIARGRGRRSPRSRAWREGPRLRHHERQRLERRRGPRVLPRPPRRLQGAGVRDHRYASRCLGTPSANCRNACCARGLRRWL